MSDYCPACTRWEIEVRESESYLRRVTRAALNHPTWPSHLEKVRAAKERAIRQKSYLHEHKTSEHKEEVLS